MTKYKYLVLMISFFSFIKIYALDDIKINGESLSPLFDKNIFEYNYYTSIDTIKIQVSKNNNEVVSGYGVFKVNDSNNEFYVIGNENDSEYKYKINVYKNYKKDDESIATFKSLIIENYDINFKNDIFEYNIDVEDTSKLNIKYELDSLDSKVTIKNNGDFKSGNNNVIINIESKDGINSNTYTVHVNKATSVFKTKEVSKEMTYFQKEILLLIIIVISCSIVVYIFYLLFIKKIF